MNRPGDKVLPNSLFGEENRNAGELRQQFAKDADLKHGPQKNTNANHTGKHSMPSAKLRIGERPPAENDEPQQVASRAERLRPSSVDAPVY